MANDSGNGGDQRSASVASRLAGATGLERAVGGAVEEAIVRTVESDAVLNALERIIEDGRLQAAVERSIDDDQLEELIKRALESEIADRVWEEILSSDKAQMLVERVANAPEVRAAITQQGFGLVTDIGRQVSRITEAFDDVLERVAHKLVRRGDHETETNQAGLATRGVAFAIDAVLLFAFLSITSGLFSSIIPTFFGNGTDGLPPGVVVALIVAGLLFAGGVFVTFWTLIGQTPGMRFLGIRIQVDGQNEIGFGRSLKRALMFPVEVLSLGLGFLAILVSPRRLAWHDRAAGTEVIYDEASAPWSLAPREWVYPESGADPAEKAGELADEDSAPGR